MQQLLLCYSATVALLQHTVLPVLSGSLGPAKPCSVPLLQVTCIDIEAMLIALAACLVPPLAQLNRHKPVDCVSRTPTLVLLAVMAGCLVLIDWACVLLMTTRPWFTGGNGTAHNVSSCCCVAPKQATARLLQSVNGAEERCCMLCMMCAKAELGVAVALCHARCAC